MIKLYLIVGLVGISCFNILAGPGGGLVSGTLSANGGSGVGNATNNLISGPGGIYDASLVTNLNAAQLTGTIPPSANQATITNQTQNIYNDTNALWFANTAGMTDQTARNNLVLGVQALKQAGVWTHIVSAGILDPLDNPGKHIDLLGNPFSVVNESYTQSGGYGAAGLSDGGTNYVLIPLPRIITNYTLVFWFWNSPSNADRLIGFNSGIPSAQAHLYNTNDFSGVVMEQPNAFRNARIWSSTSGTNWNIPGTANPGNYTTNSAAYMQNGQYDGRTPVGLMYVSAYSGGTNGIVCHFSNSKPSCFTTGGMNTNDLFLSTNSPYNMLEIGGAATNWGMVYANNTNCIATIGGWILFDSRSDGDWRYQVAGYKFATDVSRYTAVKEFGGSSVVNDSASGGIFFNGGVVCETNTMPTIYQQLNPRTLVLCDAAPGSSMANYATMQGKGTNYFSPYDILNLDTNRFIPFLMEVDTDGPRNDGLAGTSLPIIYGFFTNWSCYFSAGIPFFLIDDHWDYSTSIAGNLNWRSTIAMVVSNLPISGVIVESTHIGSNFLSYASADNPPVHNTALNWQAYQQAYGFAVLCAHQPWPYPWLDVTWNCISQGSPLMDAGITNMNQMYFPVLDAQGNQRVTQDGSGLTNGFQNTPTYTNFLFGSSFTNTGTRSDLVVVNARCNPTTVVSALFGLVTSLTGAIYTTNGPAGLEADTIFTTAPHGWFQLTAIVQPGGIWKVVDISGGGAVTITNSFYQTLQ